MPKRVDVHKEMKFLENAHGSNITVPWGNGVSFFHGDSRTASELTFHIGVWIDSATGDHISAIFVGKRKPKVVDGTTINHGEYEPSAQSILNAHKRQRGVSPSTESSSSGNSTTSSQGKRRGVLKGDRRGTWFYYDDEGRKIPCDEKGKKLK